MVISRNGRMKRNERIKYDVFSKLFKPCKMIELMAISHKKNCSGRSWDESCPCEVCPFYRSLKQWSSDTL